METSTIQQNWASGELSPKMRGRSDIPVYRGGAERFVNFFPETSGPARFRCGFQYVNNTRRHQVAWLLPFQFNDSDAYEMEFTTGFIRFYRNGGIEVLASQNIEAATQANPVSIKLTGHGYSTGDEIIISGVLGMTQLNDRSFVITVTDVDNFTLNNNFGDAAIDGTAFNAYLSGGICEKIYEIVSPYAIADVPLIKIWQNADVCYMTHSSYAPYKLTRSGALNWALATYTRTSDPFTGAGYYPRAVGGYKGRMYFAGTDNNPQTVWASKPLDSSGNPQYDDFTLGTGLPTDAFSFTLSPINGKVDTVGALVPSLNFLGLCTFEGISRLDGDASGIVSPSTISVSPIVAVGCLQQITPFLLGVSMLYIHRCALALYSLEFDIYFNAYNAIDKTLVNDHWTESGIIQMCYFTSKPTGFWFLRNDGKLIWLSYMVKENINASSRMIPGGTLPKFLSIGVMPRVNKYDQLWVVVERVIGGRTCRNVEYMTDEQVTPELDDYWTGDNNSVPDIARWRNAMFEAQKQYIHMDASLTYDGSLYGTEAGASLTPAALVGDSVIFTAGAAVFTSDMVGRQLWKQAQDGIGSGRATILSVTSSTQVVCQILTAFDSVAAMPAGQWYLTADSVGGAWHIEGETVKVVADGGEHADLVVTNGAVVLQYQASVIHIGLGYTGMLRSMHQESGTPQIPSEGREMNVNRVMVKFLNSLGGRYGTDLYNMQEFFFNSPIDLMGRPSPLFSGHLLVPVQDSSELEKHFYIQQTHALPCIIEEVAPFTEFGEN